MAQRHIHICDNCQTIEDSRVIPFKGKHSDRSWKTTPVGWLEINSEYADYHACSPECASEITKKEALVS